MCFAQILEIIIPRISETIDEIIITRTRMIVSEKVIFGIISFSAAAAPVLALLIEYTRIKLAPITRVFIAPIRTRNPFLELSQISEAIRVEYPAPRAGRNEKNGETNSVPRNTFFISFFGKTRSRREVISCFSRDVLSLMLNTRDETPKRPVSKGKRG